MAECNSSCAVDSDCIVLTDNCLLVAANRSDTQCFLDAYKKFPPALKTMKCAQPRPASDYNAVCRQNQCVAEENFETSPNLSSEPPRQGIEITLPSIDLGDIIKPPAFNQVLMLNLQLDDILWAKHNDQTSLHIKLASKPTQRLKQLSSENRGKRLRITLGHLILSEAVIQADIYSGILVVPHPSDALLTELEVKLIRHLDINTSTQKLSVVAEDENLVVNPKNAVNGSITSNDLGGLNQNDLSRVFEDAKIVVASTGSSGNLADSEIEARVVGRELVVVAPVLPYSDAPNFEQLLTLTANNGESVRILIRTRQSAFGVRVEDTRHFIGLREISAKQILPLVYRVVGQF